MGIEEDQQVPIIQGRSITRTARVTINVHKGVYTPIESKKQMFYYIQGIKDFPNESAHQPHHHQHLDNPHVIRQAIDIKKSLMGGNHTF